MKKDMAFSGLEAAIVLIAFVVVAAVFSYVMLGAGFFATQKSQEVTYSGIKQSTSNLVIDGQLYGTWDGTTLTSVDITLSIPEGGQPQDLALIQYVVTVNGIIDNGIESATETSDKIKYSVTGANEFKTRKELKDAGTNVLKPGDKYDVKLTFAGPARGGSFTVEIKPSVGAASLVTKTITTGWNGGVII